MKSNPCARTCRKRDEKAKEEYLATNLFHFHSISISRYSRRCENTPIKYWQFKKENGRYQRR